jgi:ribonuclease HI
LSIIDDVETAAKLLDLVRALRAGGDLLERAEAIGLDPTALDRALDELIVLLERSANPVALGQERLIAHADGASRGNPGDAACAVVFYAEDGTSLLKRARKLGKATNNYAEYQGVIMALELAGELGARVLSLKLDSELVVKQLKGIYKVKNPVLRELHARAASLIARFARVDIEHVRREQNREADRLANAALDGKI